MRRANTDSGRRGNRDRDDGRGSRDRNSRGGDSGRGSRRTRVKGSRYNYERRTEDDVRKRQESGGSDREGFLESGTKVYSPTKGDNCVRILPPTWDDASHFGLDVYVHYGVGPDQSAYLCPIASKTGDSCVVCEEREAALEDKDEDYARSLNYSHRVMYYVIDRDEEKEGVKVWIAPFASVDKQITAQTRDSRTGEVLYIDHPDEGYDVEYTKEGEGVKTKYTGVRIARTASDIGRNQDDILDEIMSKPLDTLLVHHDSEHIAAVFNGKGTSSRRDRDRGGDDDPGREKFGEEYTYEDVMEMDFDEIDDLLTKVMDVDIDPEDYEDEELSELQADLASALGLEPAKRSRSRDAVRRRR